MVLGRSTQQCHAADVDLLDRRGHRYVGLRHRLLEGIEIDDDEVQRANAMRSQLVEMLGGAPGQDAAVNGRVERLDTPAQNLRKAGDILHLQNRHAGVRQLASRAAAGNDFTAGRHKALGKVDEPALVGN